MPPDDTVVDDETVAVLGSTVEWSWQRIRELPVTDVPRSVVPMLGFRRLSGSAKRQIVRALDEDEDFRQAVAQGSDDADLPAIGALWLQRPEGWQDRFLALSDSARRRELEIERVDQERRQLAEIERLTEALNKAVSERDQAIEVRDHYRDRIDELQTSSKSLQAEHDDLQKRADRLEHERRRAVEELQAARALADQRLEDLKRVERAMADEAASAHLGGPKTTEDSGTVDTAAVIDAITARQLHIKQALHQGVADALEEIADLVDSDFAKLIADVQKPAAPPEPTTPQAHRPTPSRPTPSVSGAEPSARRLRKKLPGGVFEDSADAAAWLLQHADLWLVDGYNVTMARWPQASVEQQRHWLVRRLDEIASNTTMRVIFDGSEGDYFRGAGQRHVARGVHVEFSPVGVEADDVILELCASLPTDVSVVVVSNDRRVRDGARRLGANIVNVEQLFAISRGE